MRVLVTGARGQLGSEIAFVSREFGDLSFVFAGKDELNICDFEAVCEFLGVKGEKNSQIHAKGVNFSQNSHKIQGKNGGEKNSQKSVNLKANSSENSQNFTPCVAKNEINSNENSQNFTPKFDAIINCAAYTAVDRAQSEQDMAFALNEKGALNLAKACKSTHTRLIHISTDYVFDGKATAPIAENAPTAPLGVYGASKLAGERAVLAQNLKHACIVRTGWLYGEFGANFAKTIAHLGREKNELCVVNDQIGTPTNARDLARALCELLPRLDELQKTEIFHYSNEGVASWWEFAREILRMSGSKCTAKPVKTSEYLAMNAGKIIAPRPFYSVLNKAKIKKFLNLEIAQWQESLGKIDFGKI